MQWYKQIIALFSAVIVAIVFLTSCVADKFDDDCPTDNREIVDGKAYHVSFRLKSVSNYSGTRSDSGDFVDGSDGQVTEDDDETAGEEHAIGTAGNVAIFFDENKKLYSVTALSLPDHSHWPADNIEAEYGTVFYAVDGKLPSYVLVILNGERLYERFIQKMDANKADYDINAVLKEIWSEDDEHLTFIGRDDQRHFTMTNSIYVKDGALQAAVPVDPKMIHEVSGVVPDPNLPKDEVLTIYVERMLSKFTFEVENNATNLKGSSGTQYTFEPTMNAETEIRLFDGYDDADQIILKYKPINWRVVLTGWNMNALEAETYLYKSINTASNYFSGWQDAANYRTYWAEDPNYDETGYPRQYRPAIDRNSYVYYKGLADKGTNQLVNYSFTQLNDNQFGKIVYTPENTYSRAAIANLPASRADLLAGSHLIVCANLETDIDGTGFKVQPHLYRDRLGIWYTEEKECVKAMVRAFHNALDSQDDMKFPYYNWTTLQNPDNGEARMVETIGTYKLYYDGLELTDARIDAIYAAGDSLMLPANIKDGDGKRALWNEKLSVRRTSDGQLLRIIDHQEPIYDGDIIERYENVLRDAPADASEIRSLLLEWIGAVDHFNQSRMYYYAPVKNEPFKMADGSDVCGAVRNAWYQYRLQGVDGIGTPVDNPAEPIVPNRTGTYDQLKFTINLLEWHTEDIYIN